MKRKEFLAFALAGIMAFTNVGNVRIYADINHYTNVNNNLEDLEIEERVGPILPAVAKAAWARLATSAIINRITGSVSAAGLDLVSKNASQIRNAVSNAPNIHAVFDSVYRTVRDAGATESMAASIANAIRQWVY